MQRLIAKLLFLVFVSGTLVPAALAFVPAAEHQCCRRKQPHCHHSNELSFSSRSSDHDCCRSLTRDQWSQPRPRVSPCAAEMTRPLVSLRIDAGPSLAKADSQPVRAPPQSLPFA